MSYLVHFRLLIRFCEHGHVVSSYFKVFCGRENGHLRCARVCVCILIRCLFFSYRAFHLDEDNALLTYVRLQLLPPTPSPGINSPLSAPHDETEEISYEQNIRTVAHRISCTSSLLDLLVEVGSKVSDFFKEWVVVHRGNCNDDNVNYYISKYARRDWSI